MHKDLAQISKAKGIYRTLDLWAMLSPELVAGDKPNQCSSKKNSRESQKQIVKVRTHHKI